MEREGGGGSRQRVAADAWGEHDTRGNDLCDGWERYSSMINDKISMW